MTQKYWPLERADFYNIANFHKILCDDLVITTTFRNSKFDTFPSIWIVWFKFQYSMDKDSSMTS